jgi:hypothetical protein
MGVVVPDESGVPDWLIDNEYEDEQQDSQWPGFLSNKVRKPGIDPCPIHSNNGIDLEFPASKMHRGDTGALSALIQLT